MKTRTIKFAIQYKEVADVAKKIKQLAHKLSKEASKKDSPSDNEVYSYASDIAELVRTITPVIEGVQANPPSFSKIPHFIKVENTVRGGRLQVCPNEFKS